MVACTIMTLAGQKTVDETTAKKKKKDCQVAAKENKQGGFVNHHTRNVGKHNQPTYELLHNLIEELQASERKQRGHWRVREIKKENSPSINICSRNQEWL